MIRQVFLATLFLSLDLLGVSAESAAASVPPPMPVSPVSIETPVQPPAAPVVKSNELSKKTAILASMALAFNSGYSNGVCLGTGIEGTKQAVAAVTGAWTTSAYGMASGHTEAAMTQIKAILSYAAGSAIAGAMMPTPKAFKLAPTTGQTFLIGSALFFMASRFAEVKPAAKTCFFLALMANGLQNSVTSVHTANLCRSAHFSGITSDMGTFLGQVLRGNKENVFKLKVFAMLAASFWSGGFSSFFVTRKFTSGGLYACAALHFLIGSYLMLSEMK